MTTNHPANGPVSLDRLHQIREILSKAAAQSDGGNLGYAMADAVKVIDEVLSIPATLPCPVHLEPGLKFGKGVPTRLVLGALRRRADHYAELDAMTPEQRAEHDAGIEAIKAMLPKPAQPDIEMLASALTNAPLAPSDSQGKPRAPVVPDEDPRDAFERTFKMPKHVTRCGTGYAVTAYSAWLAHDFVRMWEGWNACRAAMLQAGNSPVTPDGLALVPKRLTAENGAKGVLSGEFSETKFINCPECFGDDDCETCDGSGRIEITVPVTWTTIKAIWAKGVEHFAAAPQQENV